MADFTGAWADDEVTQVAPSEPEPETPMKSELVSQSKPERPQATMGPQSRPEPKQKTQTRGWKKIAPQEEVVKAEPQKEEEKLKPSAMPRDYQSGRGNRGAPVPEEQRQLPSAPPFKAYVGKLPNQAVEEDVADIFAKDCDITDIRLVHDKQTRNFKGFGYVEFKTLDDLKRALTKDGLRFGGRNIRVDVALDKNDGRRNRREGRGDRHPRGGFRNRATVRDESPIKEGDKVNPFGAARPREEVIAERKKQEEERKKRQAELEEKKRKEREAKRKAQREARANKKANTAKGAGGDKASDRTNDRRTGLGRRGRARGFRGRGRKYSEDSGRRNRKYSDRDESRRGRGRRGRGRRGGRGGRGSKNASEETRRERKKSTKKEKEESIPHVPEFRKKPLKQAETATPTTTSNPFALLQTQ